MNGFGNKRLWSQLSLDGDKKRTNNEIRQSEAKKVANFRELVKLVADISYHNPVYSLFYRGQDGDYLLKSGASSLYPAIYRKPGSILTTGERDQRFLKIERAEKLLLKEFEKRGIEGHKKLTKFRELIWAMLQHYRVCRTPLFDITQSLRVAASFAFNHSSHEGYIFVSGVVT